MSLVPFYHEAQATVGDTSLRFVLNFRTIDAIEGLVGSPMPAILPEIVTGSAGFSLVGKVLWGLLREHHPDVTLDQAAGLMFSDEKVAAEIGVAIGDLFRRGFKIGDEKAKEENPRKRRGASKAS